MALPRLLLAWLVVFVLFGLWHEGRRRLERSVPTRPLPSAAPSLALEALLLTLFADLWFASLGSGGWILLFVLTGALMEVAGRLRESSIGSLPWPQALAGIIRITVAGGLFALVLG
jgi:hypothetical protein